MLACLLRHACSGIIASKIARPNSPIGSELNSRENPVFPSACIDATCSPNFPTGIGTLESCSNSPSAANGLAGTRGLTFGFGVLEGEEGVPLSFAMPAGFSWTCGFGLVGAVAEACGLVGGPVNFGLFGGAGWLVEQGVHWTVGPLDCGLVGGAGGPLDCGLVGGAGGPLDCGLVGGAGGPLDCGLIGGAGGPLDCGLIGGAGGPLDCGLAGCVGGSVDFGLAGGAGRSFTAAGETCGSCGIVFSFSSPGFS
jgi:hypothetical protein